MKEKRKSRASSIAFAIAVTSGKSLYTSATRHGAPDKPEHHSKPKWVMSPHNHYANKSGVSSHG